MSSTSQSIPNEYGALDKKFGAAGHMAVGLRTGVPWIMCKQDDAPDPIVSRVKTPAMAVLCMACSQVRSTLNLEVAYSYNILSDPEKRRQYDNAGFEAIDADGTNMEIDLSHRRSKELLDSRFQLLISQEWLLDQITCWFPCLAKDYHQHKLEHGLDSSLLYYAAR
ncbi:hypothetical protein L6452_14237 [Arctium lappa]|uniref:Uncharacterized protein n=1 Tax=Arctium lappa TaxID=4217 RepID=A0ACB9CKB7_ARCLA|nr:hypothetical protein L6452_14237 [Arctium lappa]